MSARKKLYVARFAAAVRSVARIEAEAPESGEVSQGGVTPPSGKSKVEWHRREESPQAPCPRVWPIEKRVLPRVTARARQATLDSHAKCQAIFSDRRDATALRTLSSGRWSCRITLSSDLCTRMRPLYSINPSLRNRFMKKLTRERVVPIMSASVSCEILGISVSGSPGCPNSAISNRILARRFSLELKRWSTRSAWTRILRASKNFKNRSDKSCSSLITRIISSGRS